jgi:hypothetical protein
MSISSPIPDMPDGKPAGIKCLHLTKDRCCDLFGSIHRPKICEKFQADPEICGKSKREAMELIALLEKETSV